MGKAVISSVWVILMLENINMEKLKAMANILGAMEIFIWDNFSMEWKMGKECGKKTTAKIQISMKEDIKMIKNTVMESFNGVQAVNTKEIM